MAQKCLILACVITAAATPAAAAQAPAASENALYCMRVEAFTGSRIEQIRCWTRAEWAWQGVDLDKDWPKEGVRVIEP
jgi:hypothetical protein